MHSFTVLFLLLLVTTVLVRLWLSQRQATHIRAHYAAVPAAFANKISLPDHRRAADYSCAKIMTGRADLIWETLWLLLWTLGGGINLIDSWWADLDFPPLVYGVGVIFTLVLFAAVLNLPFALYHTFVIETRFGFNQTTIKTWLLDLIKNALLLLILGVPLVSAILWLMDRAGDVWWLYAWILWMSFSLGMIWAYPAFIAPLFNRFSQLDDAGLCARIESLLQRCNFNSQGVFVVDGSRRSSHGNAYFTGFGNNKRIVFFDTLLKSLTADEVEAVLAHELGHFKRNHVKKSLFLAGAMSLGGFALLAWLTRSDWFYTALGVETAATHTALILFLLILPVFTYFISPITSAMSRKHEFEADEYALQNSDHRALISALVNLYRDNAATLTPDPVHSMFYDSHPPASIRISHLETVAAGIQSDSR